MTERKKLTRKERAGVFERDNGVCYLCGLKVRPGEDWDVEHEIALGAGGKDDASNWRVAHRGKCHKDKTKQDAKVIAKTNRMYHKHIGGRPEAKRKIQSRGFGRKERKEKLPLPSIRRDIYGNDIT